MSIYFLLNKARRKTGFVFLYKDFAKFDSSRSEVQDIDELNHFDLYLVHWKSLMGFLKNPHVSYLPYKRSVHNIFCDFIIF
ncbi:hypothetical protein C1T21_05945 [Paenibacillus sp. F4]|nr:hypothetical protein C1T21_05945 [Paenibacillus sp. F4]